MPRSLQLFPNSTLLVLEIFEVLNVILKFVPLNLAHVILKLFPNVACLLHGSTLNHVFPAPLVFAGSGLPLFEQSDKEHVVRLSISFGEETELDRL